MKTNIKQFVKTAAEWNKKYANGKGPPSIIDSKSYPNFKPWQTFCKNGSINDKAVIIFKYEISVKETVTGIDIPIDCDSRDSVLKIKKKIENTIKIPVYQQRLIFNGKDLNNEDILEDKNIHKQIILSLKPSSPKDSLQKQFHKF